MDKRKSNISQALPLGTILHGKYQYVVKSILGQGGFGITYLAAGKIKVDNIEVEALFAIKELFFSSMNIREGKNVITPINSNVLEVKESINSFLQEAKRLKGRKHPNIVRVNESFEENNTAYYVMEYIKGRNLRDYAKGSLSETDALLIIKEIAAAVGYLHEGRITHLDIKPDNILIKDEGSPILIDFGLAKHYDSKGRPTSTIKTLGCSDGYSPLEQYAGITSFTPEADIYALSATLFYMLTGRDPRKASLISSQEIIEGLKGLASPAVCSAMVHALEVKKEDRTHSVSVFIKEIEEGYHPEVVNPHMDIERRTKQIKNIPQTPPFVRWNSLVDSCKGLVNTIVSFIKGNIKTISTIFLGAMCLVGALYYLPILLTNWRNRQQSYLNNPQEILTDTNTSIVDVKEEPNKEIVDVARDEVYNKLLTSARNYVRKNRLQEAKREVDSIISLNPSYQDSAEVIDLNKQIRKLTEEQRIKAEKERQKKDQEERERKRKEQENEALKKGQEAYQEWSDSGHKNVAKGREAKSWLLKADQNNSKVKYFLERLEEKGI